MKISFELEPNSARPGQRGLLNIIGKRPDNPPYLSVSFQKYGNEIAHAWLPDKDLERFAVNILKALKSKKLNNKK